MANEKRLIDANALLEKSWDVDCRCGYVQVVDVGDIIDAPTVDAVEVVRCKDCLHRGCAGECPMCNEEYDDYLRDFFTEDWTEDDNFCKYGERKE